jgi:hypothetical protein
MRSGVDSSQSARRLACAACGNFVLLLEIPDPGLELRCCGQRMVAAAPVACGSASRAVSARPGMRLGGEYQDEASGLTLRCLRAGSGSVAVNERTLMLRDNESRGADYCDHR